VGWPSVNSQREVVNAIFYTVRTDRQWRVLPLSFMTFDAGNKMVIPH
jgi:transposase